MVGNPAPGNEAFDDNGGGNCMRPPNEFAESNLCKSCSSQVRKKEYRDHCNSPCSSLFQLLQKPGVSKRNHSAFL